MKRLKTGTLFYAAATLLDRGISFLILPLLTKHLSQELYAVWCQITVTVGFLSIFASLGFHTTIVQFLAGKKDTDEVSNIFHTLLGFVLLNSFSVAILVYIFAAPLTKLIFGSEHFLPFTHLLAFLLVIETVIETIIALFRAQGKLILISTYYIIKNTLRVAVLTFGIIVFRTDLAVVLVYLIILQLLLIVFMYVKNVLPELGLNVSLKTFNWKGVLYFSLPLIPYSVAAWCNNLIDRYLIVHFLSLKEASIYATSYSLAGIVGVSYAILGFTLYPYMAKLWNNGDNTCMSIIINKAMEYYFFFTIPSIAVITILNSSLITILTTSAYLSGWQTILFLTLGVAFFGVYQIYAYVIVVNKATLVNLGLLLLASIINIALNIILIPHHGILGAAIATFLSNSVLMFITLSASRKYLPLKFPWQTFCKIIIASSVMILFLFMAQHYFNLNNLLMLISVVFFAMIIYERISALINNSFILRLRDIA